MLNPISNKNKQYTNEFLDKAELYMDMSSYDEEEIIKIDS